jgi:hypothetical protein
MMQHHVTPSREYVEDPLSCFATGRKITMTCPTAAAVMLQLFRRRESGHEHLANIK